MEYSPEMDGQLPVAALEYDVGGLGATESSQVEENQAASLIVHYMQPVA